MSQKECDMKDLLALFMDSVTPTDVLASKLMSQISTAITKERLKLRMNQAEFAHHINASQSLVSRWECGDYNFSVRKIAEIFAALNRNVEFSTCSASLKIQNNSAAYIEPVRFNRIVYNSGESYYTGKKYVPARTGKTISVSTKKEEASAYAQNINYYTGIQL